MIAFIKWHMPAPHVDAGAYESRLRDFRDKLVASNCPGFIEVVTYRGGGIPWPEADRPFYADWYILENTAALDPL